MQAWGRSPAYQTTSYSPFCAIFLRETWLMRQELLKLCIASATTKSCGKLSPCRHESIGEYQHLQALILLALEFCFEALVFLTCRILGEAAVWGQPRIKGLPSTTALETHVPTCCCGLHRSAKENFTFGTAGGRPTWPRNSHQLAAKTRAQPFSDAPAYTLTCSTSRGCAPRLRSRRHGSPRTTSRGDPGFRHSNSERSLKCLAGRSL